MPTRETASIDVLLARIAVKLDQLILMVGFNLAMTVAIVVKLFAGHCHTRQE